MLLKKAIFSRFSTLKSQLEGMQKLACYTQKEAIDQIKSQSETIYQKTHELENLKAEFAQL